MATDGRLERYQEDEFPNLVATGYRITSRRRDFIIVLLGLLVKMTAGGILWNQMISTIGLTECQQNSR